MAKILILGGYGAVGREAATALLRQTPQPEVVVAGRNPHTAHPVPGTISMRVDASNRGDLAEALNGVDAVLMCAERDNIGVARACLERGIDYVDVSASHHVLAEIETLDDLARRHDATAVLSVGLAPGVTNLLARHCVERSQTREVHIGVLLGSGEQHGRAALAWTFDALGQLDGSWTMHFPEPYGTRTVHRFPFSDQYTLPGTLGLATAGTGLCLDSRLTTALLTAAGRPAVAGLLQRPRVRDLLLTSLASLHLGSDGFSVTVRSGTVQAAFGGRSQSRATGLVAALIIGHRPALLPGVRHIEQLVEPATFLAEVAADGFALHLGT